MIETMSHCDPTVEAYNRRRSRFVVFSCANSRRIRLFPKTGTTAARNNSMAAKSQGIAFDQIIFASPSASKSSLRGLLTRRKPALYRS
jgi:hypothetical protein